MRVALVLTVLLVGCGATATPPEDNLFLPGQQTALFEKGLVLPYDSLPCTPLGGAPQNDCNHHGSSIAQLADGTIAIAWFHGEAEKSVDSRIVWAKRAPGASTFAAPEVLFDDPTRSEGNAVLWVHESQKPWLFFVNIEGNGWGQARMRLIQSMDEAGTAWTAPKTLSDADCWMLRYPPVRLSSGELFLPGYYECLGTPVFVRSKDDFATWTLQESWKDGTWLLDHPGQIQPSVIVTGGARLAAVLRDGSMRKRVMRMTSEDDGKHWTAGLPTGLPNPGVAVAQVRLKDGHVVVVFNNSVTTRAPLTAALSLDDGAHFVAVRDLVVDDCADDECSYPHVIQSPTDGTIWVSYTHRRKTIGWVHFNEKWLQEGGQVAQVACTLDEACVEGRCYPSCPAACPTGLECAATVCRKKCSSGCASGEECDPQGLCRPAVTHACAP
jgi:predicted neuraminidase